MPADAALGLPTVNTMVALFEGRTGRPVALIDGHAVTNWKTAADSALAQRHLARDDARRLLMIGAPLAPYLVKAHLAVRPTLDEVQVCNRTAERARAMVAALAESGIDASVASRSRDGSARGRRDQRGDHGAGTADPRRLAAAGPASRSGRLVPAADARSRPGRDAGGARVRRHPHAGQPRRRAHRRRRGVIEADLYELCQGSGRRNAEEITVFKNAGGGHLDLMTAEFIAQRLGADGIGAVPAPFCHPGNRAAVIRDPSIRSHWTRGRTALSPQHSDPWSALRFASAGMTAGGAPTAPGSRPSGPCASRR